MMGDMMNCHCCSDRLMHSMGYSRDFNSRFDSKPCFIRGNEACSDMLVKLNCLLP